MFVADGDCFLCSSPIHEGDEITIYHKVCDPQYIENSLALPLN